MSSVSQLVVGLPVFIPGSIWYIAVTRLLFLIWRELQLIGDEIDVLTPECP